MELKTKYQYTYFIYPYIIEEKQMGAYYKGLFRNPKCKMRIFDQNMDMSLYSYFLPVVRDYLFWTFNMDKKTAKQFDGESDDTKAAILMKYPCSIFEYELKKDVQAKIEDKDGIFFEIRKLELICFNTGVCFLLMKTALPEDSNFQELLDFNYKFCEIPSSVVDLKNYEKIKLQTDMFEDTKSLNKLIQELIGPNKAAKKINLDTEKFITYSYACIDQETWKEKENDKSLETIFNKYRNVLPSNRTVSFEESSKNDGDIFNNTYVKYGFSNTASCLLTSNINMENYTKLLFAYENEYLYTYILSLYKRIYLKKIEEELSNRENFEKTRKKFLNFTSSIWTKEFTYNRVGKDLCKRWEEVLLLKENYESAEKQFDLKYKNSNLDTRAGLNKLIVVLLIVTVIIGIINLANWLDGGI